MDKAVTIKAADLSESARRNVSDELHIKLADSDELIVTVRREEARADEHCRQARERLLELLRRLDARNATVADAEVESAVDEAMSFVRRQA
jgi:hypothetical protein